MIYLLIDEPPEIQDPKLVRLWDDMLTIKSESVYILESRRAAHKDSGVYERASYKTTSLCKFGDLYLTWYSNHPIMGSPIDSKV